MKVLFVAAEGVPFVKTGGLADVVGSLPHELRAIDLEVRVVMPKYQDIPIEYQEKMQNLTQFTVPLGWRNQYCGVEELEHRGVPTYFLDNQQYFQRPGIYGYPDDGERFSFFCRAVLEMLPQIDFQPDVIHCHDWHTGMVSTLLQAHYGEVDFYRNIKTVFTIHNLRYQGTFPKSILGDLLGLDDSYYWFEGVEFHGEVSFMKAGIVYSDIITTVSKTYAQEIQQPYYGERLDGLLQKRKDDLHGIINGIDYQIYNPELDPRIEHPFDRDNMRGKTVNKKKMQHLMNLPIDERIPVVALVTRLVSQKGLDLVECVLHDIMELPLQFVVLGCGDEHYEKLFSEAAQEYSHKFAAKILYDEKLAHQIYAGADIFLMPSLFEPCGLGQMIALRYGTLPLVRETGGLKDTVTSYNEKTGEGNGFSFTNYNAHDMLYTLKRAISLYQKNDQWQQLRIKAMGLDYSWNRSAREYRDVYQIIK
ncbi:starch synthase [Desulfitispora alkaliphila]|uniref:glycogen synthase GlgA n=1 Tax=Desulfitispora alkaliphila TaxID=622674 RepID=UPI003D23CDA3